MKLFSPKSLVPLLILTMGAAFLAVLIISRPRALPIEPKEKAWLVAVERVQPRTLGPELPLYGRVESPRSATLAAAISADIVELPAREGMLVEKGALLVGLDDRDSRLKLQQQQAELDEIEAEIASENHRYQSDQKSLENEKALLKLTQRSVQRVQRLKDTHVASESGLEEALQAAERQAIAVNSRELAIRDHQARVARLRARRERASALRDLAQLEVERSRILAPFAARVARVPVALGTRVRPGDGLVELYDTKALEVRAQIPSRYQSTVYRALETGLTLPAEATANGGVAELHLDRLAGRVIPGSGGVDALFRVIAGETWLRQGDFVSLTVRLPAQSELIAIPYEALYGTDRVYTMVNGRMRAIKVERIGAWTAPDLGKRVLVRSDALREGDLLITTQLPNAIDGLRVQTPES